MMQSDSKEQHITKPKCKDCKMCQNCSENRCLACRGGTCRRQLSIQEQIELFNRLNPHLVEGSRCKCAADTEE